MATPVTITNLTQVGRLNAPNPADPKVYVSYKADFSTAADIIFDFTVVNQQQVFGIPRGLFIDNGANPAEVIVLVSQTNQRFTVPANAEGYFKIDASAASTIEFITAGGATSGVTITLYNYEISPNVWYKFGAFNLAAALPVKGVDAEGVAPTVPPVYIAGKDTGGVVRPILVNTDGTVNIAFTRGTYTDRSGSIAVAATSQQLAASNLNRKRLFILNPATAAGQGIGAAESLFINFTNAATINGGNSIELQPGQSIDLNNPVTTEAVTVIAATLAHKFVAKEM